MHDAKNYYTFWSMEPPYVGGRLRYHLGQVYMLERMAENIRRGGCSSAVICDPPVILSARARPDAKEQRDTIHRFLRAAGSPEIAIYYLSELTADLRQRDELRFEAVEAQVLASFAEFNTVVSGLTLSHQAMNDLSLYRSADREDVHFSLRQPLGLLKQRLGGSDAALLATLYAFKYRASWFESHNLAATAAALSSLARGDLAFPVVVLEARRNAYPWLVLGALYQHAAPRGGFAEGDWPILELSFNIPNIDNTSYMRLAESEKCLFLDGAAKEYNASLRSLSASALQVIGGEFPGLLDSKDPVRDLASLFGAYRKRAQRVFLLKQVQSDDPEAADHVHLILRGGGAKGLALVGAIDELWSRYAFRQFWGTSAGAIVAVLLGAGYTPAELVQILKETSFEMFLDRGVIQRVLNLLRYHALHRADNFEPWLEQLLKEKLKLSAPPKMRHLPLRTVIFAAQRDVGTVRFDSHGENKDALAAFAVRSSMAIPLFFRPTSRDGRAVYDGGLTTTFPLRQFKLSCPNEPFIGVALRSTKTKPSSLMSRMVPTLVKDIFGIWTSQLDFGRFRQRGRGHFPCAARYGAEFRYCLGAAVTRKKSDGARFRGARRRWRR